MGVDSLTAAIVTGTSVVITANATAGAFASLLEVSGDSRDRDEWHRHASGVHGQRHVMVLEQEQRRGGREATCFPPAFSVFNLTATWCRSRL